MINIKGRQVSEETIEVALQEYFKTHPQTKKIVPIISFAQCDKPRDRLVINLTPRMINRIKQGCIQIIICDDGSLGGAENTYSLHFPYSNQEPIFGKIEE